MDEAVEIARPGTNGQGPDAVIVTVGVVTAKHVSQALTAVRKDGTVVVIGTGKTEVSKLPIDLTHLVSFQKRLVVAVFGMASPFLAVPSLIRLYEDKRLKLDEMITTRYSLDQIAEGYRDIHAGVNIRGTVSFD